MMINYALIFLVLALLIMLLNFFKISDFLSKIVCLNSIVSYIVLLCAYLAVVKDFKYYLDLSLVYGLLGGITSIAFLKYFISSKHK